MKKKSILLCAALSLATAFSGFVGCDDGQESSGGSTGGAVEPANAASYIKLDINPDIELTVDAENKVISVYGGNEDGLVLLYEETGIVGTDVKDAVEKIVDLAVEMGYLDEENKVIGTSVVSATANAEQALLSQINAEITATAQDLGLSITTDAEGAYSLLRDLEELKAAYPTNTAIQNVSVSKFQLAVSASETGEVTLEAAVEMNTDALVKMVAEAHTNMEAFATDAFKQAKTLANATYDKALGMAKAGVYMEYASTKKMQLLPYGAAYFMYGASACGFEAIADSLMYVEMLRNYELSDTQIDLIMTSLGLQTETSTDAEVLANRKLLEDADGKVTVKSVEAYADKLFKNSAAGEQLEGMKTALNEALTTAESTLKAEVAKAKETYGPQIEAIIASAEAGLTPLKTMSALLPAAIQQAVADFEKVAADVRTAINEGTFNEAQLRVLAKEMKEKAEALLTEANAMLSEDEKAEINTKIEQIVERFANQKAEMDTKIAQAEEQAKAQLASWKAQRKAA